MKLTVNRADPRDGAMMGMLFIDSVMFCMTLEDVSRPAKIAHETAIPAGTYKVTMELSPKFKKRLPLLHDVPGFTGILIHSGNTAEDTWGCILVGQRIVGTHRIEGGSIAMPTLAEKIEDAIKNGEEVTIEINNLPQ